MLTRQLGDAPRSPELQRWARLRVDIRSPLRRGAWYQVLSAGAEEAVVAGRSTPVVVPRDAVEITNTRPNVWSVVPLNWLSGGYLVCPGCATRVRMDGALEQLGCLRCGNSFSVERVSGFIGHSDKDGPIASTDESPPVRSATERTTDV